jgi:hypothetical protein
VVRPQQHMSKVVIRVLQGRAEHTVYVLISFCQCLLGTQTIAVTKKLPETWRLTGDAKKGMS